MFHLGGANQHRRSGPSGLDVWRLSTEVAVVQWKAGAHIERGADVGIDSGIVEHSEWVQPRAHISQITAYYSLSPKPYPFPLPLAGPGVPSILPTIRSKGPTTRMSVQMDSLPVLKLGVEALSLLCQLKLEIVPTHLSLFVTALQHPQDCIQYAIALVWGA